MQSEQTYGHIHRHENGLLVEFIMVRRQGFNGKDKEYRMSKPHIRNTLLFLPRTFRMLTFLSEDKSLLLKSPGNYRLINCFSITHTKSKRGPNIALPGGNDGQEGEEVVSKYRPLLLNLLPKGPLPSSGPSKCPNNVVN